MDDGQDAAEVGGPNGPGTIPKRVCDVLSSVITYEHHTSPGQEERTLARAQGSERHGALPGSPRLPLSIHVRCHPETSPGDCEESDTTRGGTAAPGPLAGQGGRASTHSLPDVQHHVFESREDILGCFDDPLGENVIRKGGERRERNTAAEQMQGVTDEDTPQSRGQAASLSHARVEFDKDVVILVIDEKLGVPVNVENKIN